MINTSSEYKNVIDSNNREFTFKLVFTFTDGTSLTVDDKRKLMSPGLSYDGATSSTGSFDIGSAIITKMDISLNNKDGEFDAYIWKDASVAVYVGLVLSDHTEMLRIGTYYVDKAVNGGVTKVIKCLGALALMDKDFSISSAFPSTVYQAYYDACTTCGVLPAETSIECGKLAVEEKPDGVTCREVAGYAAMLSGGVVCEDPNGKIYIKHYDSTVVKSIIRISSRSIEETDITITGIQVNYGDEVYQSGTEEYALAITDNPLISSADSAEAAASTALKNLSAPFRPLTIKTTLDPALQPGDRVEVITGGKTYTTYATSVKWTLNGGMTVTCGAKTESDQSSDRYGAVSKTIITSISKQVANEAINAYDLEATQLNTILTNAMGFYETTETLEDGSQVKYVHDKPELADSQIIYKRTVDGFGYSTDGGQTYASGWTADGNILAKVLTVIGIDADWIRANTITIGKLDSTLQDKVNDAVASVEVLYALSSSANAPPEDGWSQAAPEWESGKYMWQKTVTTYADGSTETSDPVNISGSSGQDATLLRLESSRGTAFKNNDVSTDLSPVIYYGSKRILDIDALHDAYGASAHLQWSWRRMDDDRYGIISADDSRLSAGGFLFTLSPDDVDVQLTVMCELIV